MWIARTPEEAEKWRQSAEREARSDGRLFAGLVWIGISVLTAGGWFVSRRMAVVTQALPQESYWPRLGFILLLGFPIAYFIYRRESRKAFVGKQEMTICLKCEAVGDIHDPAECACGGTFVPVCSMKWIEPADSDPAPSPEANSEISHSGGSASPQH